MKATATDILILGAGVAGLAAASELSGTGKSCLILEARDRIGGRVLTLRDPVAGFPMEVGAEFIHGEPESTLELTREAGVHYYDGLDAHFHLIDGKLKPMGRYWDRLEKILDLLEPDRPQDRSFAEVLKTHESEFTQEERQMATSFIEGFQASDANMISEKDLALGENDPDAIDESKMFKVSEGYDLITHALAREISHLASDVLRLERCVKKITWRKSHVEVEALHVVSGATEFYNAKKLIVTLPLGVLQAPHDSEGGVQFEPRPQALEDACDAIRMGTAMRLSLRFRHPVWEKKADSAIGFLHAGEDATFRTWWTPLPAHHPFITAWSGGPRAEKLSEKSDTELVTLALKDLSQLLKINEDDLRDELLTVAFHNWKKDPYARGSYTYVAKGGVLAAQKFHEPVDDTLYFAGEATVMGSERGTVSGAISSGRRAARLATGVALKDTDTQSGD